MSRFFSSCGLTALIFVSVHSLDLTLAETTNGVRRSIRDVRVGPNGEMSPAWKNAADEQHDRRNVDDYGIRRARQSEHLATPQPVRRSEVRTRPEHFEHAMRKNDNGALMNVMYGVITNQKVVYQHKLQMVMNTWGAAPIALNRFLVMGGRDYPVHSVKGVTAADCDDTPSGNPCKEASLVIEAAKHNASWLFIVGEDNYVDTKLVEAALQTERTDIPVGLGCLGCGRGAKDVLERYGNELYTHGGFCGSCGEALNYAALKRLAEYGREALVNEYGNGNDCDLATSAAMHKRSIPLRTFPGQLIGTPIFRRRHLEKEMARNAITFHYVPPEVMRWIHAKKTGVSSAELLKIEATAFEGPARACLIGMNGPSASKVWREEIRMCLLEENQTAPSP